MDKSHKDYRRTKDWVLWRIKTYSSPVTNGCIEWQRGKSAQGYGLITITLEGERTRTAYTHRILWELTHDVELGRNICVCHKCDNPSCVNLKHLFVGTRKENSQDMSRKGRASNQGKKVPYDPTKPRKKPKPHSRVRKYTDEQIRAIKQSTAELKEVASQYGVSASYVSRLRNNKAKTLL